MTKLIFLKTIFIILGYTTLLLITFLNYLQKTLTTCGARKVKMYNANSIKACVLSKYIFSGLTTLHEATFKNVCLIVNV
jgi:hypothetical protein